MSMFFTTPAPEPASTWMNEYPEHMSWKMELSMMSFSITFTVLFYIRKKAFLNPAISQSFTLNSPIVHALPWLTK